MLAHLNVRGVHQRDNGANRNPHMATRADLMAHDGHALFALVRQAIVMLEDWRRDFLAQFGNRCFRGAIALVGELKLLKFQ